MARMLVETEHEVYAVIREGSSTERLRDCINRLRVLSADLRDVAKLRGMLSEIRPECAIHLAWYAAPKRYWTATENLDHVAMSLSLAQVLSDSGCRRLVAAGSCAEYDWDYGFLSEDHTPLRPRTLYGASKNACYQILRLYCQQVSMEFAWMRFFYLYGPGEAKERLIPSVILALLNHQKALCSAGKQIRDFLHVEDVASAVCAVAQSKLTGPVNIGSGQPVKVRELVEQLGRILHAKEKLVLGALPTDPSEPPVLLADVRKLKLQTGWTPAWELENGLRHVVSWWRQKMGNGEQTGE